MGRKIMVFIPSLAEGTMSIKRHIMRIL
jgi:hypothetical protein